MSMWLKQQEYHLCLFRGRQKRNWILLGNLPFKKKRPIFANESRCEIPTCGFPV